MYWPVFPIFLGFILIGHALGDETTKKPEESTSSTKKPGDSGASYDKKMKNAVQFMDTIHGSISKDGVDVEKLLDVMSLLGPKFEIAGMLIKLGLKIFKVNGPAQLNDTMADGFAEVNSRLQRIEARIKDLGNVVGDELTIAELRSRVGGVIYLQGEYIGYVNVSNATAELGDVLRECRSPNGDPKKLVKFVEKSVPENVSPTFHNILGAVFNKAQHNRTTLWNWFNAILLECVQATTMELICQSLEEGRDERGLNKTALELGRDLKAILDKMVQYDRLLIQEFANDEIRKPISLYDEIKELIQNYKTKGFDQGMADHLANHLKSKYDFAYWGVTVARDSFKVAWIYEHVIHKAVVTDKVHAKLYPMDNFLVIVNWSPKEYTRLDTNKANFKVAGWMDVAAKDARRSGGYKCDDVLVQFSKTEWFPRHNISVVYSKQLNNAPFFAGDWVLTDCSPKWYQCGYWGERYMQSQNCYGYF